MIRRSAAWMTALVLLVVAGGFAFWLRRTANNVDVSPPVQVAPATLPVQVMPVAGTERVADVRQASVPPHPMAVAFGQGALAAEKEPAVLLEILQAYRRVAGSFPTAEDNPHLMKKLRGEGAGGVRLFPAEHARYDAEGALLDAWGTPFFFHHVGAHHIEVRSAGPDRVFYSADDLQASSM